MAEFTIDMSDCECCDETPPPGECCSCPDGFLDGHCYELEITDISGDLCSDEECAWMVDTFLICDSFESTGAICEAFGALFSNPAYPCVGSADERAVLTFASDPDGCSLDVGFEFSGGGWRLILTGDDCNNDEFSLTWIPTGEGTACDGSGANAILRRLP